MFHVCMNACLNGWMDGWMTICPLCVRRLAGFGVSNRGPTISHESNVGALTVSAAAWVVVDCCDADMIKKAWQRFPKKS